MVSLGRPECGYIVSMRSIGLGISARLPPTGAAATKEEKVAAAKIVVSFIVMLRMTALGKRHVRYYFG